MLFAYPPASVRVSNNRSNHKPALAIVHARMNAMDTQPRHRFHAAAATLLLLITSSQSTVFAQGMDHHQASIPSTQLTLRALAGKSVTLTPEDIAALPHKTVSVFNSHTKSNEKYSGVSLSDLLNNIGVPQGENVKGKVFMTAVIAAGTDKYSVLYALAEVDPSIHTGEVIVADSVDGQKLGKDGAFKLVSTEERRPARWVRNLTEISVIEVKQ